VVAFFEIHAEWVTHLFWRVAFFKMGDEWPFPLS
jgi:hypothetical protein